MNYADDETISELESTVNSNLQQLTLDEMDEIFKSEIMEYKPSHILIAFHHFPIDLLKTFDSELRRNKLIKFPKQLKNHFETLYCGYNKHDLYAVPNQSNAMVEKKIVNLIQQHHELDENSTFVIEDTNIDIFTERDTRAFHLKDKRKKQIEFKISKENELLSQKFAEELQNIENKKKT